MSIIRTTDSTELNNHPNLVLKVHHKYRKKGIFCSALFVNDYFTVGILSDYQLKESQLHKATHLLARSIYCFLLLLYLF